MSDADLNALAAVGVIALWVAVLALYLPNLGIDPARIPVIGPFFERTWNALVSGLRKALRIKD